MTLEAVTEITRNMLLTALLVASPVLVTALVVGLFVSLMQAITQIHEMTLTFIPKILSIVTMLLILIPWILQTLVTYAVGNFKSMNSYIDRGIQF